MGQGGAEGTATPRATHQIAPPADLRPGKKHGNGGWKIHSAKGQAWRCKKCCHLRGVPMNNPYLEPPDYLYRDDPRCPDYDEPQEDDDDE